MREFGQAFVGVLLRFAERRDAYMAEHGAWTRPIWDGVARAYMDLWRAGIDREKARQAADAA